MTTPEDFVGEQLLSGELHPDDAPQPLKDLAGLIQTARTPAPAASPDEDRMFIAAIAAEVHRSLDLGESVAPMRQSRARRLPSGRVATLATGLVLTGGLAAAAATGSLPAPIQRALSHGVAHIGIRLPLPHTAGPTVPTPVTATTVTRGAGGTRTAASNLGLCETYLHLPHSASPRVPNAGDRARQTARLATAAASHNEGVHAYCESLVHPNAGPIPSGTGAPADSTKKSHPSASTTPSRPSATPRGSHAPSTIPASSRHQRTHQTGVHTPGTTTAGTGSAQPRVSTRRSVTHGTGAPAGSTKSGHMGAGSTTTSSLATITAPATSTLPATSPSGTRPVNSHSSNKGGGGVSAAQTN